MPGTIRKYFTCANSSKGFVNYFSSSLEGMEKIYILKGGPGTGKSTLMKKIGNYFLDKGEDVEYIYCSSDASSLDGVIICGKKAAIVDGTAPHVIEPQVPGAIEEYVNLGDAWDGKKLQGEKEKIRTIKHQISYCYDVVYQLMKDAKTVHDAWEQVYVTNTDYEKLNQVSEEFVQKLLNGCMEETQGTVTDRFFGATTPDGSVNYIENLTGDLEKRYFIKGRPGTGKSTLLKKLASQAQNKGLDVEVYHCSFDPDSLDMVIMRGLGVCVFDSTAPHELFPSRDTDEIIDLYEAAVKEGTDEDNAAVLAVLEKQCGDLNAKAREQLGMIHTLHDELEKPYIAAMDFKVIDKKTKELIKKIAKLD